MSNRPTPETDAVAEKLNFEVDIDFARKLERERDEARNASEAFSALAWKLEGERNEAREQAAMWKANHDNQVSLKAMLMDRPDLGDRASRIAELIRERDEAREKYDALATEHMLAVNNLCEERDEAREQVNRYRYNLDLLPIKWDI